MESVEEKGQYLKESLEKLKDKYPEVCVDVRGLGLMMGLQMTIKPSVVINKCREKGVILCSAGYDVVGFVPPLIISKDEIDIAIKALDGSISECAN